MVAQGALLGSTIQAKYRSGHLTSPLQGPWSCNSTPIKRCSTPTKGCSTPTLASDLQEYPREDKYRSRIAHCLRAGIGADIVTAWLTSQLGKKKSHNKSIWTMCARLVKSVTYLLMFNPRPLKCTAIWSI